MPSQREVLRTYAALKQFRADWRGAFLLRIGLDDAGRSLALAALAAGAATLVLEGDAALLKTAGRDVTFTVTTLEEALRALKNEVRQKRAVTVALSGDAQRWLGEMVDRGVQPDVVVSDEQFVNLTKLLQLGAERFAVTGDPEMAEDVALTALERRQGDVRLLQQHPDQAQWLNAAPTLFSRDFHRAYLLDDERLQPLP